MRAKLVGIHAALTKFEDLPWLGIFTDSLSSLQAIRSFHDQPGLSGPLHYHYHSTLIQSIVALLETRHERGLSTTLRKIRGRTHIRGNDLADTAAKLAVREFDKLPPHQTLQVELGSIAPRPPFWVMFTNKPPAPPPTLATGPRQATLRPPWWTIPEADRAQMHAFTRPSLQLRQKVRGATLRGLHHTSLYRRLILQAREKGARTKHTGAAILKRLKANHAEGITLLKFVWGQLYNGKLAHRYGHAPTDACPLCGLPDSCTHIAGECDRHHPHRISRHNAACQLIHATLRKAAKGGGALHSAPDLVLVAADAGIEPQLTEELTEFLHSTHRSEDEPASRDTFDPEEWDAPPPPLTGGHQAPATYRRLLGPQIRPGMGHG